MYLKLNSGKISTFHFSLLFILALTNFISSSVVRDLTDSQNYKLEQFKKSMSLRVPHDYMKKDVYLIPWLVARNFDVNAAEQMLLKNLKWRKDNRIDTILLEDWTYFEKNFEYNIEGCDKSGRHVVSIPVGDWKIRDAVLQGNGLKLMRYFDKYLEEMSVFVRRAYENGNNVTQYNEIYDLSKYTLLQQGCPLCIPIYVHWFQSFENHYPGATSNSWAVNVPQIFGTLWILLNPLLSKNTRETIFLYSRGQERNWQRHLREYIDREQLTMEFGGTKENKLDIAEIRRKNGTFQCTV